MNSTNNVCFREQMTKRIDDLRVGFVNFDRRKRFLYLTTLLSIIVIVIVVIVFLIYYEFNAKDFDYFNKECLKSHNQYRSLHRVNALKLDEDLIKVAKGRAEYLVATDIFEHPKSRFSYGENLHYIMPYIKKYSCHKVVKPWYDEIKDYNYIDWAKSTGKIGHFTQVVWKSTERMGCAQAYSQVSQRLYTVCNYSPPGNYVNRYNQNVLLPLAKK